MPDQDSEDEGTTPKTNNDMDSDTKSTVYKSSLEHLLPTHCLHCGILRNKADSEWSVLDVCIYIYIKTVIASNSYLLIWTFCSICLTSWGLRMVVDQTR